VTEKTTLAQALANRERMRESFMSRRQPPQPPVWSSLPPYQAPGAVADKYMPFTPPPQPQQMPPVTVQASPLPTPMMAAAAQQPQQAPLMPPPEQYGPQEPYGPQAPPMPRNELERDYFRQLTQNPGSFDKGWLGRLFG
jgi:hypothetical protein